MKILTAKQLKAADLQTIKVQGISSADLMERAALAFTERFMLYYPARDTPVKVFCGTGNNGGDGLAIACMLAAEKYPVIVFIVQNEGKASADFNINYKRIQGKKIQVTPVRTVKDVELIKESHPGEIAIDALLGIGLNRPVYGLLELIIHRINTSFDEIIAIDVPSGMYPDQIYHDSLVRIHAHRTWTFGTPKLAFMFASNYSSTGDWEILPIGLDEDFIRNEPASFFYLDREMLRPLLKKRQKFVHKGTYGHALLISGSYGKIGAAILAAQACLHSGAGLLTVLLPECGYHSIQTAVPEAMALTSGTDFIYSLPTEKKYQAVGIGPGIGIMSETARLLAETMAKNTRPMVIDADAINILSEHIPWMSQIPKNSILTPHIREFDRLAGPSEHEEERFQKQQTLSKEYGIIIILKGACSCITLPDGNAYFNSTGNPGMATAGMGDVLTGILTSLLAQGYQPHEAALLGTYLHGWAGDKAIEHIAPESLTAGQLIPFISGSFNALRQA